MMSKILVVDDEPAITDVLVYDLAKRATRRAMAVKAAVEKARGMAGAAGLALGDVPTITDNSQWFYYGWAWNGHMSAAANLANMAQNVAQASAGQTEAPPEDGKFSLGKIVVLAQVDLTAAMK